MTQPTNKPVPKGPSSELVSRINHLSQLLKNLLAHLPLNPNESKYKFGLDTELISEEGVWFAFNKNLEACFETHKIPTNSTIIFTEQGRQCDLLIATIKQAVKRLNKDVD